MLWKCCFQYVSKFGNLSSGHRTGKGQFSFQSLRKTMPKNAPIPKKDNAKECSNYRILALISHANKVMLKILQARLLLVLEKAVEPEIKLSMSAGSSKKQESSRKTSISALLTMPKPLTVWITINCGKFWMRWEYQTTWPASWETYLQFRKQQLELDNILVPHRKRSTSRLYIVTLLI